MVVMGVLLLTPCSPSIDLCMEVLKAESGDGSENPPKTEDGRRKESEVGRRKESEVGRRKKSEVGRRKESEVGRRKESEVGRRKTEAASHRQVRRALHPRRRTHARSWAYLRWFRQPSDPHLRVTESEWGR